MEVIKIFTSIMGTAYLCASILGLCGAIELFVKDQEQRGEAKFVKRLKNHEAKQGMKLSKKNIVNMATVRQGIIVIAPPGSGKTSAYILNNLLGNHLPECSKIIADTKDNEIWSITHNYREKIGEKCIQYIPLGGNVGYNPLDFVNDFTEIRALAQDILKHAFKDDFDKWCTFSVPLFTAALLFVKKLPEPYRNISHAVNMLTNKPIPELAQLFEETKDKQIIQQMNAFMSCSRSPATMDSIMVNLLSALQLFVDPKVAKTMKHSDFTPEQLRSEPVNIYLTYDFDMSDYLSPLLSIWYSQMFGNMKKVKGLSVIAFMDEFQQLGKIPKIEEYSATLRHYDISIVACIQNVSKLYQTYGREGAEILLENLQTKCLLPGIMNRDFLEWTKVMIGQKTEKIDNGSGEKKHITNKPLMDASDIRRIPDDHVLILNSNNHPILIEQDRWYDNKQYIKNGG